MTLKDRITKKNVYDKLGIASIRDKMRENRLSFLVMYT